MLRESRLAHAGPLTLRSRPIWGLSLSATWRWLCYFTPGCGCGEVVALWREKMVSSLGVSTPTSAFIKLSNFPLLQLTRYLASKPHGQDSQNIPEPLGNTPSPRRSGHDLLMSIALFHRSISATNDLFHCNRIVYSIVILTVFLPRSSVHAIRARSCGECLTLSRVSWGSA